MSDYTAVAEPEDGSTDVPMTNQAHYDPITERLTMEFEDGELSLLKYSTIKFT
jgi:hypothetical protein